MIKKPQNNSGPVWARFQLIRRYYSSSSSFFPLIDFLADEK